MAVSAEEDKLVVEKKTQKREHEGAAHIATNNTQEIPSTGVRHDATALHLVAIIIAIIIITATINNLTRVRCVYKPSRKGEKLTHTHTHTH